MNDDHVAIQRYDVEQKITPEMVSKVHALLGANTDIEVLRVRLIHILTRYERYSAYDNPTTRNDKRKQITRMRDASASLLKAIDGLDGDVRSSIESALEEVTLAKWENWSFESDKPIPEKDKSLEQGGLAASRLLQACNSEFADLEETKGQTKKSTETSLNQLLIDLEGIYEHWTDFSAKSHCYYTDIDECYAGPFFEMAKVVLDFYAPNSYVSEIALGKRIQRVLSHK